MPKDYLQFLQSNCKEFKKKNRDIYDIVIYGSFAKGNADFNDVDIIVLFNNVPLDSRLRKAQALKAILKKEIPNLDVKTMNFDDFFNENFLARQSLLIEGLSAVKNKRLSELLGFSGFSIFTYNLKNLDHNKKTQFTYALSGRNSQGMLRLLGGKSLGRGAVQIPIANSSEFESFLTKWNIGYKIKNILESKL